MSEKYSKRKGKECSPASTIIKIEEILRKLGIIVIQEWNHALSNHYSVNLRIAGTNLYSNGKGTSMEYTLASAYAEMMERLQTMALFRFHSQYMDEVMEYGGYTYTPDELKISISDIALEKDNYYDVFSSERMTEDTAKKWMEIENVQYLSKKKLDYITMVPFKDITTGDKVYFPIKMVDLINGSNGMCAGNTYEEAMVQGISELCERYVNKVIIQQRITPPEINIEYIKEHCKTSYSMITSIKRRGYDVIVKDCSLGKGFPVVACIIINKKLGRFFVKFGAQPNMDIAIERCLTETFQGRNLDKIDWFRDYFYSYDDEFEAINLSNILHSRDGFYPYEFFMNKEDYSFKSWNYEEDDNVKLKDKLVNLIIDSGYKLFVRDWSFLGFPTYQIVSPSLSNIYDSLEERVNWHKDYAEVKDYCKRLAEINDEEFVRIIDFMKRNRYTNNQGIINIVGIPVDLNGKWSKLKKDYFIALYNYKKGKYEEAYTAINNYVNTNNNVVFRCLRHFILLRYLNKNEEEIVIELSKLYSENIVFYVRNILEKESSFENYNVKCSNCNNCKEECYQKGINNLLKVLKKEYIKSFNKQKSKQSI